MRRIYSLFSSSAFCAAAALVLCSSPASAQSPADTEGYDIIIVAGQSNAAGAGLGPENETVRDQDHKIFQIRRQLDDPSLDMTLIEATSHLDHWASDQDPEIWQLKRSFDMAFARRYAAKILKPNRRVVVVPAALGGSSILRWDGTLDPEFPEDSTRLADDMNARITAALQLPKWSKSGRGDNRIVAFHWQQGEADITISDMHRHPLNPLMSHASLYRLRLQSIFEDVRARFPNKGQTFPIIFGEPVREWKQDSKNKWDFIAAMRQLHDPAKEIYFVSSEGLASNHEDGLKAGDRVHFSARSQTEMGARRFEVFSHTLGRH